MFDLLVIEDFLDSATREEVLAELQEAHGASATVFGQAAAASVEPNVRKTIRVAVQVSTRVRIIRLLLERREEIEKHFGLRLGNCEEPQFLCYETGNFFVAHQDGNTPLVRDESRFRRVSVVIFLNARLEEHAPAPGTYSGGELVFHGRYPDFDVRHTAPASPGALVAFRSETTHEVLPVTHGERYSIVSWFVAG